MFDQELKDLWKRSGAGAPAPSPAALEELLRKTTRRNRRSLAFVAWTVTTMLGVTALLAGANLVVYRGNAAMLAFEGVLGGVSVVFLALAMRFLDALRQTDRVDVPLLEAVERRIAFHERTLRRGIAVASVTPWMLSMAITTMMDVEDGAYRVNHPVEFGVVTAVMVGFVYASMRIALDPLQRELHAVLHDLRAEALEEMPRVQAVRRRARRLQIVGAVLLTAGVVAGLLAWAGVI